MTRCLHEVHRALLVPIKHCPVLPIDNIQRRSPNFILNLTILNISYLWPSQRNSNANSWSTLSHAQYDLRQFSYLQLVCPVNPNLFCVSPGKTEAEKYGFGTADLSHTNPMTRNAKPACVAARAAILCPFGCSLDEVIALSAFDFVHASSIV